MTINQELVAGDTSLLASKGRYRGLAPRGSAWARLGSVDRLDLRCRRLRGCRPARHDGTLDDFGARTMGAPPPDTEPPSAPGTLTATPDERDPDRPLLGAATDNVGSSRTGSSAARAQAARSSRRSRRRTDDLLEHRPHRLDSLHLPRARRGRCRTSAPTRTRRRATTLAPPDTEAPTAPANAEPDRHEPDPDRPHLECRHGQRASDPVPHRALLGRGLLDFARSRPPPPRATRTPTSPPRPPTPTACAPRTPYSNTAPTRPRRPPRLPRRRRPGRAAADPRHLQPPQREPSGHGWTNGIGGPAETGLRVVSNTVGCTKTTTCTAWRANRALPRTWRSGRASRRSPATATSSACTRGSRNPARRRTAATCCGRTSSPGTDQVLLERIDAGVIVTRLTITRELALGRHIHTTGEGDDARGLAQARIDVVAARKRRRLDVRRRGTRRNRYPRQDRPARRLRRALARGESRLCRRQCR